MKKSRVVVTGMGVVSPIGNNLADFWSSAVSGKSGVRSINRFFVPENVSSVAGIVTNYLPETEDIFNSYEGDDRTVHFALDALSQALSQAKLDIDTVQQQGATCSIVLSSAVAAISSMERYFNKATSSGKENIKTSACHPNKSFFKFNYLTDTLAQRIGINGRSLLLPTGCAGCLDAIAYSVSAIRDGLSDIVITGASEAPITPLVVTAFNKIGATSTKYNNQPEKASRPFDRDRDGFVLAEGCGILILESLEFAQARGAHILAEISGVGSVNNCYHMTNIPQDGVSIARSCQLALDDAGILADEVDHINAHGSSTPQNDVAETQAFKKVFGSRYQEIPVTSNKSFLGHALAASNALETILSIKTLQENIITPTINLENQDENCTLNVVADCAKSHKISTILKNSSGFSGIHSSIVLQEYKGGVL